MRPTPKRIRTAVIGIGYLGKYHVEKYQNLPEAELVAICDNNETLLTAAALNHQAEAVNDYKKLINRVDAVSIATPTTSHFEIAKFFLENGVHVLLEKPITATLQEADKLVKIAQKYKKLIFTVGHIERLNPAFLEMSKLVKKPLFIEARRLAPYKNRATDVSVVVDLMIHDIDLILKLAGAKVKKITARGQKLFTSTIDNAQAVIEFSDGCIANLVSSRIVPSNMAERKLQLIEQNACYSADLGSKMLTIQRCSKPGQGEDIQVQSLVAGKSDALYDEIKAFLEAIQNKSEPLVSAKDAKAALEIAIQIEKLAKK